MNRLHAFQSTVKFLPLKFLCPSSISSKLTRFDGYECYKTFPIIRRNFLLSNVTFKEKTERTLPTLVCIQNPFTWIVNKLDFRMLKNAWDDSFEEKEFKLGSKQAISVICYFISEGLWDNLKGLVTKQALIRLKRDVEMNWSDEKRKNILIDPGDIKIAIPKRVHFLRISEQRFVDIDMVFLVLKFKEKDPSLLRDLVYIEIFARFHRNYTEGQIPNWTVSIFKGAEHSQVKLLFFKWKLSVQCLAFLLKTKADLLFHMPCIPLVEKEKSLKKKKRDGLRGIAFEVLKELEYGPESFYLNFIRNIL